MINLLIAMTVLIVPSVYSGMPPGANPTGIANPKKSMVGSGGHGIYRGNQADQSSDTETNT